MKNYSLLFFTSFFILSFQCTTFCQSTLVISQVFGGAGCSFNTPICNTPYTRDYVEIFNRSGQPININGFSLQIYNGTNWNYLAVLPDQVLNPGQYFSIGGNIEPGNVDAVEPGVDMISSFDLEWDYGSIALVSNSGLLIDCPASMNNVLDKVGYGLVPGCFEGSPGPGADFNMALYRKESGCQDLNQNAVDFLTAVAVPRNLSSALYVCPISSGPVWIATPAAINGLVATASSPSDSVYLELMGHNLIPSGNPTEILTVTASPGIEITCAGCGTFYAGEFIWPYGDDPTLTWNVRLAAGSVASPFFTGSVTFSGGGAVPLVVPINGALVPIQLKSFKVAQHNNTTILYWSTTGEINSKLFIVQRSTDAKTWTEIAEVNATGNSTTDTKYNATDFHPLHGINYYRLKEVDIDANFVYSEIRSIYFGANGSVVLVPNPAKDKVVIYLPGNPGNTLIQIFNSNGQLMKRLSSGQESVEVNLRNFVKGVYSVKVTGKDMNEVRKLVVE